MRLSQDSAWLIVRLLLKIHGVGILLSWTLLLFSCIGHLPNFLCDLVVLKSICYLTRAKRLINDNKTIGELRQIWTGIEKVKIVCRGD